ncbi:hypothetical protein CDD83_5617 [Cordyceps sp. RAO-2017]|nr:hypothetical protein CDD83_5617 [Cordyceps sp. RAO-2017]
MTLLLSIVNKLPPFLEHLEDFARSEYDFKLANLLMNLTFDIIGAVVIDENPEAQHLDSSRQGELIKLYGELLPTHWDDKVDAPWWLIHGVTRKLRQLGNRLDVLAKEIIAASTPSSKREQRATAGPETCDQTKTFLLAGHDNTSTALAWVFYELPRTPRALKTVRDELDSLFGLGTSPEAVVAQLLSPNGLDLVRTPSGEEHCLDGVIIYNCEALID